MMKKAAGPGRRVVFFLACVLFLTVFFQGLAEAAALPGEGHYVRRNRVGMINGEMDIMVRPGVGPVISVFACGYRGNESGITSGFSKSPGILLGGTVQAAQNRYGARFVIGAKTKNMLDRSAITSKIPVNKLPSFEVVAGSNKIILRPFGKGKTSPDISGIYVMEEKDDSPWPDKFKAYALLEMLPSRDTGVDLWSQAVRCEISELNAPERSIREAYPSLGTDREGYEIKVFNKSDGSLRATFVVTNYLEAVYRIDRDGRNVMIYNADGAKG